MELIKGEKFNKLVPSEGYVLKLKTDNYIKEIIDEEGNIVEPEHLPNYSSLLYLPLSYTLEDAQSDYEEKTLDDYPWKPEEPQEETIDTIWEDALLSGLK